MARLKEDFDLKVLEDVERMADGYFILNILLNLSLQIITIYATINLSTYIWRLLSAPC